MNDSEEKLDIKYSLGLYACLVLIVIQAVSQILSLISVKSVSEAVVPTTLLILLIGFAYYVLFWYKKPHGNSLKYLILFYVAFSSVFLINFVNFYSLAVNLLGMAKIIALSYIAGRLNRVKENKIIFIILVLVDLCFAIYDVTLFASYGVLNFKMIIGLIASFSFTAIIALAYLVRYKLHKEAGLEDKKRA